MQTTASASKAKSTTRKPVTRNRSVNSRGFGRTPMGACSTVKTLMYRMTGVGPVVTMTAKQELTLAAHTIDHRYRTVLADAPVRVPAGTTLHFIASETLPNWYYIVRVASAEYIFCSCPASQNRLHCEHADAALVAYKARQARANRQIADEFVQSASQLEDKTMPEDAYNVPTECPEDVQEFSEEVAEQWTQEELSYAEQLKTATPEQRRAIWKQVQKDARAREKQATQEYWAKVHELRAAKAS